MADKFLIVVDMQKDFVNGALGTKEAEAIVPAVLEKVKNFEGQVIFTKDTHFDNYLSTSEGKMLPVEHCIKDTDGWMLIEELEKSIILKESGLCINSSILSMECRLFCILSMD